MCMWNVGRRLSKQAEVAIDLSGLKINFLVGGGARVDHLSFKAESINLRRLHLEL